MLYIFIDNVVKYQQLIIKLNRYLLYVKLLAVEIISFQSKEIYDRAGETVQ